MARQVLGALTTLNLSTNLDPMFLELYNAAGGNFSSVTGFYIGGTGALLTAPNRTSFTVNGINDALVVLGVGNVSQAYIAGTSGGVMEISANTTARIVTNNAIRFSVSSTGVVTPGADNAQTLGAASLRWSVVYAGTGTINTSDAREKTEVDALNKAEIAASIALGKEIGGFKFLSAIKEKGDGARFHIGMTVQRAMEVMDSHGLDPLAYAFICHDAWEEVTTPEEKDEEGKVTKEAATTPAGDRYGFRADELALFIMRGLVARLDALEA